MTDPLNDSSKTTFEAADPMADVKRSKFVTVPIDSNNSSTDHFGTPISGIVTPGATNGLATPSVISSPAGFNSNSNPNTPHFEASTLGTPNFTSFQEGNYSNSSAISPMESQPIDTSKVTTNIANSPTAMPLMDPVLKNGKSSTNLSKQQTAKKQDSPAKKAALSSQNPEELADAVAAAGVNIRAEEEAMVAGLTVSKRQMEPNNFLKSQQLAWFMRKKMKGRQGRPLQPI